jgi:sporulation protein YlmC with PRC-barrel domain
MAHDKERLRGDTAGVGPQPGLPSRLHRLSESHHYRIAAGEPDIRGWEVRNISGGHLGEVEDLLIDPHRGEVVMLDVDLDESPDHINLPIRSVQLDRGNRSVIVDSGDIRDAMAATTAERDRDRDYDRDREIDRDLDRERDDVREPDVRERIEADRAGEPRDIRYGAPLRDRDTSTTVSDGQVVEETVIERRPIVEEVVVRRKVVDEKE